MPTNITPHEPDTVIRPPSNPPAWAGPAVFIAQLALVLAVAFGCGTARREDKQDEFFTSGSREADQRASQRMAKDEQLAGSGEGAGEKGVKKAVAATPDEAGASDNGTNKAAVVEGKLALFDRLGGEKGITAIVDDFTPRVLQDPRVNWERTGVNSGFSLRRKDPAATWNATDENVKVLKKHLVQFIILATGGPPQYEGKNLKSSHAGMKIGNAEFDAVLGDLKASLDRLQIPNREQKELLSIIESTRPLIVTER
jgi:hemoglobin